MADYFSEFGNFIGAKGLPTPTDTPYETPGFIRSKRSSRATTAGSIRSREQSGSPPPLPPDATDYADKPRDGRYSALDPRRFTPTLHASLVSEILSLRRDLDSKNSLVENLEMSLASTKDDNDILAEQLADSAKEVRIAKSQVQQMENGTYEALEAMVKERDAANQIVKELKSKIDIAAKKTRRQDEDAERTQSIWESEKESWENERRQLERRVHVTEARLRTFVDELGAQQAAGELANTHVEDFGDNGTFKDSGLGNDSETTSLASPKKSHKRNLSSISFRHGHRSSASTRAGETPEPFAKPGGYSLADELGIDEEDEFDDEYDDLDEELDHSDRVRRTMESRQESVTGEPDSKAKRVLGLTDEVPQSPSVRGSQKDSSEETIAPQPNLEARVPEVVSRRPKIDYVDTGYQPSPPPSPPREKQAPAPLEVPARATPTPTVVIDSSEANSSNKHAVSVASRVASSPISPPETPVIDGERWPPRKESLKPVPAYTDTSTQTDVVDPAPPKEEPRKRDSLQPPPFVPSIAIHPPTSRPSSPRPYVLPPGTKNASSQVSLPWNGKDASVQTEGIRIDKRPVKLPAHLLPTRDEHSLAAPIPPKPKQPPPQPPRVNHSPQAPGGTAKIYTNLPPASSLPSPPVRSPTEASSSAHSRAGSSASMRSMPLKQIPLPKPTLAPAISMSKIGPVASQKDAGQGPLNRSAQFGVSQQNRASRQLAEMEDEFSDFSDEDDPELEDVAGSMPEIGRFKGSDNIQQGLDSARSSPQRRPTTADSMDAAPAPSIASSRGASKRVYGGKRPPPAMNSYLSPRSRSPSFASVASSSYSTQSALPPYAIPTRSSSRVLPPAFSNGPYSPTPDSHTTRGQKSSRGQHHQRHGSLRKVQSASTMRGGARKYSPQKPRRRRRSPDLTPVQSMAFESPQQTKFPIPELPTPLQTTLAFDWGNRPSTSSKRPDTAASSIPPVDEPQAQLVDSIAATMVGEWMWKYIRRRKSFGVDRETTEDFAAQAGEDRAFNVAAHGTRHKRWVWLSPYERTIMWDSKQPTSGTALLGKKGRKLAIQSVLDVPDSTALAKKPELPMAHHRSILILTPSRALKFTAVNAERHAHWLSALTFLAESERMQNQLPPLPLVPPIPEQHLNQGPTKRQNPPVFGRANVRDSVRIAKGKHPYLLRSSSAQNASITNMTDGSAPLGTTGEGDQGADFPSIPRLYSGTARHQKNPQQHQRKRSNTSPRLAPPFTNLRSFSSSAVPTTSYTAVGSRSTTTNRSSRPSGSVFTSSQSGTGSGSRRPSVASPDQPNFFEAFGGTHRMEAFVDPAVRDGVMYVPAPPLREGKGKDPMGRGGRNGSVSTTSQPERKRTGRAWVVDERGVDPFRGF